MKKEIIFNLQDIGSFSNLTKDYFFGSDFRMLSESKDQICFTKGSLLNNMVTSNPLNWKSEVKITVRNDMVLANFEINTYGQLVTPKEENLWNLFIENYKESITNKLNLVLANEKYLKEIKRDNLRYLKSALLGAVIFWGSIRILSLFYRNRHDSISRSSQWC